MAQKTMTFVQALKDFFGPHPDGRRFIEEVKGLTKEDRAELKEMLTAEGYDLFPIP